ncbi:MAG: hypothetical protein IJ652_02175 [Bacteroidales bacterium]|nr:hypothetical protein [Bacteroidales bacterium]
MKTRIVETITAAGIAALAAFCFVQTNDQTEDLFEKNVEVLADEESSTKYECYDTFSYYSYFGTLQHVRICDGCKYDDVYRPRRKSVCPR